MSKFKAVLTNWKCGHQALYNKPLGRPAATCDLPEHRLCPACYDRQSMEQSWPVYTVEFSGLVPQKVDFDTATFIEKSFSFEKWTDRPISFIEQAVAASGLGAGEVKLFEKDGSFELVREGKVAVRGTWSERPWCGEVQGMQVRAK